MTEALGGKYRAIKFARERILEQERRAQEAAMMVAGEEASGDLIIVAGEDSEDLVIVDGEDSEDPKLVTGENSEDPDDPQFRPAVPLSVAAATEGMKKDELSDGAGFR